MCRANPLQLPEVAMRLAGAAVEVSVDAGLHRISRRGVAVASHAKRHRPKQRARALTHEAKLRRPTLRQPTLRLRATTNNLPAALTGRPPDDNLGEFDARVRNVVVTRNGALGFPASGRPANVWSPAA